MGRVCGILYQSIFAYPFPNKEVTVLKKIISIVLVLFMMSVSAFAEKIDFSEMTLEPCGGYSPFKPEEWDLKLGDMLKLPEN